jgi:hypothetical protein
MSAQITKTEILASVKVTQAIAEAIRELGTVADGTLYAGVMSHLDLGQYKAILGILEQAKLITNVNHRLTWIGGVPR